VWFILPGADRSVRRSRVPSCEPSAELVTFIQGARPPIPGHNPLQTPEWPSNNPHQSPTAVGLRLSNVWSESTGIDALSSHTSCPGLTTSSNGSDAVGSQGAIAIHVAAVEEEIAGKTGISLCDSRRVARLASSAGQWR
jgi:hypothetical protein